MSALVTPVRCAIYTRKSSEEGLDQSFNSLDAQREAGEAYVASQAHEGWSLLATRYDDGGYSGGSMERPGLQRLLADIAAGQVDVVVVYKIDRLTRSLADFARIVEIFEKVGTSFVSVTQSFNTTNSMGRLMLNVLLSFAQFEREVTGERIRDKIAASKAKGLWMGGNVPLGYDLPAAGTRILQVNQTEAASVRHIFTRYLELGSVHALQRELTAEGIVSKQRVTASGKVAGGTPFSRGALFHLLRNRIYLGLIIHRTQCYPGEHVAIVPQDLFERVQQHLDANARRHHSAGERCIARAPLAGRIFDAMGEPMSPTFSHGKSGRAWRYYVSASLQKGAAPRDDGIVRRLSASALERLLAQAVTRWLPGETNPLARIATVHLRQSGFAITLGRCRPAELAGRLGEGEELFADTASSCTVLLPIALPLRGGRRHLTAGTRNPAMPDPVLIGALRKAHRMLHREKGMPFCAAAPVSPYDRRLLRLAFLSPKIQRAILTGHQPAGINLETLMHSDIPLDWAGQRAALGWQDPKLPVIAHNRPVPGE